MTKPLGYYMNHITHEGADAIERLLRDLSQEDKLGLIEWLTNDLKEDLEQLRNSLEAETY